MTTHSSMLAWEILWTEEPGRLQSMGSQRVRHDWATGHEHTNTWYFDNSSIMLKKRRPLRTGLAAGLEGEMLVRHTPVQYSPKINFVPNSPLHMMSCLPVSPLGRHFYPQFAGAETRKWSDPVSKSQSKDSSTYSSSSKSCFPHQPRLLCMHAKSPQSCLTLWDAMDHSLPGSSVGFFRREYWSGLPCPPPGDLPDLGIKLASLMSPPLAGEFFTTELLGKPPAFL